MQPRIISVPILKRIIIKLHGGSAMMVKLSLEPKRYILQKGEESACLINEKGKPKDVNLLHNQRNSEEV